MPPLSDRISRTWNRLPAITSTRAPMPPMFECIVFAKILPFSLISSAWFCGGFLPR